MKASRACRPHFLLMALALVATAAPASAKVVCKTANARYRMVDWPDFTVRFVPIGKRQDTMTDVALEVRSRASGKAYWFIFDRGSARYVNLISTTDARAPGWTPPSGEGGVRPLRDMRYMAANAALRFDTDVPGAGKLAPTYILLPDLAEVLHYGQKSGFMEDAPTAFFKLEGC